MLNQIIYSITPIKQHLALKDPFISTMHHLDHYPAGNENLGPTRPANQHEYNMYHGEVVPGFPAHPHTGFETITLVEQGYIDHFDSLGNAGRYSAGDAQWVSTGNGIEHCEMFPLVHADQDNPLELFQIWLNSSPEQKQQDAAYKMLWREDIPHYVDQSNHQHADLRVISGQFKQIEALDRPLHSWSTPKQNKLNIFLITLAANSTITIPATSASSNRFAYFYQGQNLVIAGSEIQAKHLLELKADSEIVLQSNDHEARILWLEGEPIGAPVAAYGPFVLNSREELEQAFQRYQKTHFGGWPWSSTAPVFEREKPRYASFDGGKYEEYPDK